MNQQVRDRTSVARHCRRFRRPSWNRLHGTHYPFLRHEFLLALEESGCVCAGNRLDTLSPDHHDDQQERWPGAMPLYRKTNSFGEFVFDWAWADAYRRAGLHYYPKLVSAVPYTPASSTRLLHAPGSRPDGSAAAAARVRHSP